MRFPSKEECSAMLSVCLFLFIGLALFALDEKDEKPLFTVKVSTDRQDAIYHKGDKAKFLISLLDEGGRPVAGKPVNVSLKREIEKLQAVQVETKEEPVEVEGIMNKPGFILCAASFEYGPGKKAVGMAGAGFDPFEIKPPKAAPADFMQFWDAEKARLESVPMNPILVPVEVGADMKGKVETFDLKLNCSGGAPVSGYYSRPVNAVKGSCPAFLNVHGAGVSSSSRMEWGAAQGLMLIAMDINAHGIDNGKPQEFYDELENGRLKGYPYFGCDDRDTCYFKGMFLRVLRALEFLKAQPEWDGKTLVIWGSSQGGAQALVGAALDPQVTFCVALVPAMCNHSANLNGYDPGWPHFVSFDASGKPSDERISKSVPYYDIVNFTPYIKAQTFVTTGFIDITCCPSSVYAAYNNIAAQKEIVNYPLMGHVYKSEEGSARLSSYLENIKKGR